MIERHLIAKWVRAETLSLKRTGYSLDAVAAHITQVGRGQVKPKVPLPPNVNFPLDYSISMKSIAQALKRALAEIVPLSQQEMRELLNQRLRDMLVKLQPRIQEGNLEAVRVARGVIESYARLNGLLREFKDIDGRKVGRAPQHGIDDKTIDLICARLTASVLGESTGPRQSDPAK